jgi:hypothetical protein
MPARSSVFALSICMSFGKQAMVGVHTFKSRSSAIRPLVKVGRAWGMFRSRSFRPVKLHSIAMVLEVRRWVRGRRRSFLRCAIRVEGEAQTDPEVPLCCLLHTNLMIVFLVDQDNPLWIPAWGATSRRFGLTKKIFDSAKECQDFVAALGNEYEATYGMRRIGSSAFAFPGSSPSFTQLDEPSVWVSGQQMVAVVAGFQEGTSEGVLLAYRNSPLIQLPAELLAPVLMANESQSAALFEGVRDWSHLNGFQPHLRSPDAD